MFEGHTAFGHDHLVRNTFFGVRVHSRCSDLGPVARVELMAGDVSGLGAAALISPAGGVGIGDRNY